MNSSISLSRKWDHVLRGSCLSKTIVIQDIKIGMGARHLQDIHLPLYRLFTERENKKVPGWWLITDQNFTTIL
jgi:hypothetical protein